MDFKNTLVAYNRLHLRKIQINLVFRSICTISDLRSKILSLENTQINLVFRSICTISETLSRRYSRSKIPK